VRLEGLGLRSIEKSNDLIGIRTRDLPAFSIVPQPTTLPRAPYATNKHAKIKLLETVFSVPSDPRLYNENRWSKLSAVRQLLAGKDVNERTTLLGTVT
jgi:hypothetical protein